MEESNGDWAALNLLVKVHNDVRHLNSPLSPAQSSSENQHVCIEYIDVTPPSLLPPRVFCIVGKVAVRTVTHSHDMLSSTVVLDRYPPPSHARRPLSLARRPEKVAHPYFRTPDDGMWCILLDGVEVRTRIDCRFVGGWHLLGRTDHYSSSVAVYGGPQTISNAISPSREGTTATFKRLKYVHCGSTIRPPPSTDFHGRQESINSTVIDSPQPAMAQPIASGQLRRAAKCCG